MVSENIKQIDLFRLQVKLFYINYKDLHKWSAIPEIGNSKRTVTGKQLCVCYRYSVKYVKI